MILTGAREHEPVSDLVVGYIEDSCVRCAAGLLSTLRMGPWCLIHRFKPCCEASYCFSCLGGACMLLSL